MELVSPTAAHRIRIAVALVLLDTLPSHLSISGEASGGSLAGREVVGSTNGSSVASRSHGLLGVGLGGDDIVAPTNSEAVELAHKISPLASQIVSLLIQSPVTSPSVVSELLKLVSNSLESAKSMNDHGTSASSATQQGEAILGAARLSMWMVERVERNGVVEGQVESYLGDLLSTFISVLSSNSSLPASTFLLIIQHALSHLPKPTVSSLPPTLVEQALSSFVILVQSLSTGIDELQEVQQRLFALVGVLELVVSKDEGGSVSHKAKEGLTRIIAEFGVSELVGVEVEGAVLALLEDFEVEGGSP
ncbi:hypothetical protein BCR35DRAFT_333802 [Leucosporidium creatinivorum]|uniref:Neurochondrin-domain-containing protein n=1 Tax=Leucosporidium creatinivorum TaxID=106004 RepID=A0A1Y2ENC8_9BASI|nr:hypothetical protein BCR35DRAFT_333802 [Leucosporidium creatinivorum]